PGTRSATQIEGTGPAVGARYELAVGWTTLRYEIAELEPPRRVQARARSRLFTSVDTVTVEPAGDGALVTYHADLRLNGPLSVADPLLGVLFHRMGEQAADGLASALDGSRRT
ncbi:MAG TPA: SRPBCC family protein, partial [Aquihabitans sp.]|nr:SRPBCC family protein [Aquihabitans sp.]